MADPQHGRPKGEDPEMAPPRWPPGEGKDKSRWLLMVTQLFVDHQTVPNLTNVKTIVFVKIV